jgi:isoleucyl-tRNA synthetase
MSFKEYKSFDAVEVNNSVLEKWKREKCFESVQKKRASAPKFVFFEGPPSANGMPGIHHVMARTIKDSVCRYKTMRGFYVRRKAGWDTHGLPVELNVEKKLGITKENIGKTISIADYNAECRKEVMKYTTEWVSMTEKMGYWVDMNDPYITYDNRYIETLWYLLKKIYDKGLLYKGYSIQPYSPAAGTGLSSHELNQPGCYRDVKDTTCVAQFKVIRDAKSESFFQRDPSLPLFFLAWTTTPWTLPSNTALCVGPGIDYVTVRSSNPYSGQPAVYIVAEPLIGSHFNEKIPYEVVGRPFKGAELKGIRYEQLIPFVKPDEGAFRVITGDFVTTEDGTGVVHIAPTFGADDDKVGKQNGVPGMWLKDADGTMQPMVDRTGKFYRIEDLDPEFVSGRVDPSYKEYAGRYVKNDYDASLEGSDTTLDIDICVMLKRKGQVFKIEKHVHSYPHCWRTDKPVLYYPLDSWFIRSTAVRDRLIELNKTINWHPEYTGSGRFGKWLENLQDWNLSRSRFWGTPLPIWRTEDGKCEKCIGSVAELYDEIDKAVAAGIMQSNPLRDKGFDPKDLASKENYDRIDLHRPYVDGIYLVSDDGRRMVRESDLIDVWFDSGSMPYAEEGLAKFGDPEFGQTADFIAEGVDQTRGWFFTLHTIHTMVSDSPAFKNVISNGLVLDRNGDKMSKRLGNAVDPFRILDDYGADPTRWYMITNSQPWDNLKFDEEGIDEVRRKFFGTLYNTYSFFALYANIDDFDPATPQVPVGSRPEIDKWIISLLNTMVKKVTDAYDDYDLTTAGRLVQDFVCNNLSNWYVRLNRKRFWGGGMTADKLAAYQTLYECLVKVALLAAPIAPFYADRLYTDLVPGSESVHCELMPVYCPGSVDSGLEERMDLAQKSSSMILALRRKVNIKVRQPLAKIIVPVVSDKVQKQFEKVENLILTETDVKEVEYIHDISGVITRRIKPNFRTLGKKYGKRMKEIAAFFPTMSQELIAEIAGSDVYTLNLPSGDVELTRDDYEISSEDMPGWLVATEGQLTIALEITVTEDLRREGTARELINRIQNMRKDCDFEVTDRISVVLTHTPLVDAALESCCELICRQTLAVSIEAVDDLPGGNDVDWEEGTLKMKLTKMK